MKIPIASRACFSVDDRRKAQSEDVEYTERKVHPGEWWLGKHSVTSAYLNPRGLAYLSNRRRRVARSE